MKKLIISLLLILIGTQKSFKSNNSFDIQTINGYQMNIKTNKFVKFNTDTIKKDKQVYNQEKPLVLRATYYYAHNGALTADGTKIKLNHVKSGKQRICAMSRDMFNNGFSMGDTIFIEELNTHYVIADKTHKRFRKVIDILQHHSHEPMKYTRLTIRKVSGKK